jgi:ceramide glucosyltransferase
LLSFVIGVTFLFLLLGVLVAGSLAYSALSVIAALRYLAVSPAPGENGEPISVLKPLSGLDEGLEENLRTFFEQDYRQFELVFAVREESDACVPLVRRLCAEYARVPSRLILVGEPPYLHAKVYSLARMLAEARHELLVMSDSDIRVRPDLLRRVAAEFAAGSENGQTALATCPYRAVAGRSFWSHLEAAGMNTTFWQGVLTARMLDGMKFAVGPTIVARRKAIEAIGGIERVKDYIAEDFDLGRLVAAAGFRVILSSYVIEHRIGTESLMENFAHRIRWGRTSRRSRPAGYLGQIFMYPLPLAFLLAMVTPHGWPVLAFAAAIRYASAWVTSQMVLGARLNWILLPLEDVLGLLFWVAGFFGNTITWRGRTYRIDRQGRAVA